MGRLVTLDEVVVDSIIDLYAMVANLACTISVKNPDDLKKLFDITSAASSTIEDLKIVKKEVFGHDTRETSSKQD